MKKSTLLLFFLINLTQQVRCQTNSFVNYFGDSSLINYGHSVVQLPSGSIFSIGYSENTISNYGLIHLTKFDQSGTLIQTTYYGDSIHHFMAMRAILDNQENIVIAGGRMNDQLITQPYSLKVDTTGNVIWQKEFPAYMNSQFNGLCIFPNDDIGFSGFQNDSTGSGINFLCTRTNSSGDLKFTIAVGDPNITETSENCLSSDNNLLIVSGDKFIQPGIINPYVIAVDSTGNLVWDLVLTNSHNCGSKNLFLTAENELLVVGESATDSSAQFDIFLNKIDINAPSIIWTKYIRGSNESDAGFGIAQKSNGNYLITGYGYDTTTSTKRIVLIETDTSCNELSKRYYGNSSINIAYDVKTTSNGGYLIAGTDFSNDLSVLVYQAPSSIDVDEIDQTKFITYPNPILSGVSIHFNQLVTDIRIYNHVGEMVSSFHFPATTAFQIPTMNSGIYFLQIINPEKKISTKKLVILNEK